MLNIALLRSAQVAPDIRHVHTFTVECASVYFQLFVNNRYCLTGFYFLLPWGRGLLTQKYWYYLSTRIASLNTLLLSSPPLRFLNPGNSSILNVHILECRCSICQGTAHCPQEQRCCCYCSTNACEPLRHDNRPDLIFTQWGAKGDGNGAYHSFRNKHNVHD
jgi:hypothetical protein